MAFDSTNPVSVGDITKKTQYDTAFDNTLASLHKDEGTDTFFEGTAELRMNNNTVITGKEAGGTARNMLHITGSDVIRLGDENNNGVIMSNITPRWNDGTYEVLLAPITHATIVSATGGSATADFYSVGSFTFLSGAAFNTRDTTLQVRRRTTGEYEMRLPTFMDVDESLIFIQSGTSVFFQASFGNISNPDVDVNVRDDTGTLTDLAWRLRVMRLI